MVEAKPCRRKQETRQVSEIERQTLLFLLRRLRIPTLTEHKANIKVFQSALERYPNLCDGLELEMKEAIIDAHVELGIYKNRSLIENENDDSSSLSSSSDSQKSVGLSSKNSGPPKRFSSNGSIKSEPITAPGLLQTWLSGKIETYRSIRSGVANKLKDLMDSSSEQSS